MESRKQKREFCDGLKQLEARLCILERERNTAVFGKRANYGLQGGSLEEYEHQLTVCRKAEKHELQEQIQKVRANVSKLHRTLANVKATPQYVEQVKVTMEDIESSVLTFKEKQRKIYEELLNEEEVTVQEITAFEKKMDSWTKADDNDQTDLGDRALPKAHVKVSESMPSAVVAFEKFLQSSGGHTGGWDEYDHQIYLKFHLRHRDLDSLMEDLAHQLPARTSEDLKDHHEWYMKYKTLLHEKKVAITQWKEKKKAVKKEAVVDVVDDDKEKKDAVQKRELEKQRELKQAKLQQWKSEQLLQKKNKEEQERLAKEKELQKAKEKEKQRQLEAKKKVEEYVKQKETEREEQRVLEEVEKEREKEQKRLANREIERFRERDMKAVEEKLQQKLKEDQETLEKERKLDRLREKVRVHVSSDPARLHKLTEGLQERVKQRKDPMERGVYSTVRDVPHRLVPTWRQGL